MTIGMVILGRNVLAVSRGTTNRKHVFFEKKKQKTFAHCRERAASATLA
jgi:hypothetical protein